MEVGLFQAANEADRLSHLLDVLRAAVAASQVLPEAQASGLVEGAFKVVSHKLDQLLAGERAGGDVARYRRSTNRTQTLGQRRTSYSFDAS